MPTSHDYSASVRQVAEALAEAREAPAGQPLHSDATKASASVGRAIDVAAESAQDSATLLENLGSLPHKSRNMDRRSRTGAADRSADVLPSDCQGVCSWARQALEQLVQHCGQDQECWRRTLDLLGGPGDDALDKGTLDT